MVRFAIRRLFFAVPTLLIISLIIFAILDLAPGDPTSQLPLTIPQEQRELIREQLGVNEPFLIQWLNWVQSMFINEPAHLINQATGFCPGDCDCLLYTSDAADE